MTEPTPTNADPPAAADEAVRQPRDRWRSGTNAARQPASRRVATGAALALTALAAIALSTALIVAPLFSWQTAAISLVVDDYPLGVLPTVPFAQEDTSALATSLSGRVAPSLSGSLMQLKGFDTVEAMRDRLHGFVVNLPLRGSDSMIAYVRGQCLVPPPPLDADGNERPDPLGGHACLVATDASLRGEGLREMVPCRDIVESIGSAASLTTLVAMDLGDLRWDPRIGVLCSLVPRQLDQDFKAPPLRANGQNWLLASHDTLQYSGASGTARRTFFSAALEQGLAGAADQPPWGDGDRVVELHELAPFVSAWTFEWSRRSSGGSVVQRPAVWKLGVGRVALRDIPRDIRLVRVVPTNGLSSLAALRRMLPGSSPSPAADPSAKPSVAPTAPEPAATTPPASPTGAPASPTAAAAAAYGQTTVASGPAPSGAAADAVAAAGAVVDATAAPKPSEPVAAPAAPTDQAGAAPQTAGATTPPAPAAGEQPQSPAPVAPAPGAPAPGAQAPSSPAAAASSQAKTPVVAPPAPASDDPCDLLHVLSTRIGPPPASTPQPSVIDFAPHIWRQAASFVAVATTEVAMGGPRAERSRAALQRFKAALAASDGASPSSNVALAGSPPAEAIVDARRAARAADIPQAWAATPRPLQAAIAARNDAVELAWSMLDVIGQLCGGAGVQFVDAVLLDEFLDSIARLTAAIEEVHSLPSTERDTARLDPLATNTQYVLSQTSLMRSLRDQVLSGRVAEPAASSSIPLHDRLVLLRSRLPDKAQRAMLLTSTLPAPAAPGGDEREGNAVNKTLEVAGRLTLPSGSPRTIAAADWRRCAALVGTVVDLVEAAGITAVAGPSRGPSILQPSLDDVAATRRAIAALENAAGEDSAAAAAAGKLAARMSKLFERAAIAAARSKDDTTAATDTTDPDRVGGLLRTIDPRDAALVGDRAVVGPARWNAGTRHGLRVVLPAPTPPRLGIPTDIEVSVADASGVPVGAALTLRFDPAQIAVRLPDGTAVGDGVSVPASDLPWRGVLLTLQAVPLRLVTTADPSRAASLTATLSVDAYAEKAECSLPLPTQRSVPLAARGDTRTITGIAGEDGWVRATQAGPAGGVMDDTQTSILALSGRPSRVTTWQLGLDPLAGAVRKVDVELYAVPITPSPDGRERAWADAVAALLDGRFSGKPLARAKGVQLSTAGQVAPLVFKDDDVGPGGGKKDSGAAAAPTDGGTLELPAPQPTADGPGSREIGPDLAVVVRDAEAPAATRPMITRIALEARHPRDVLSAIARYDRRARTITVSLSPVDGAVASLPPEGMRVTLREPDVETAGDGATATGVRMVVPRKPVAALSATAPTDDVVASWNGPDQGTARFALDVDGYPRGFLFAVDCSPAADMQPQGPQHDWRQIRILTPKAATTLLKAPAAAVPMRLAVDAPADTFLGGSRGGGSVALVLRQIGGGLADPGQERVVWTAASDRQVTFSFESPPAGASLAIRTSVDDWTIAPSGEGFANVDVSAAARLVVAGSQSPLTDSRILVFDGQPPFVDAPPSLQATVGKPLVVAIQASDDSSDGYLIPPERRRPGVSGLKSVEWALDPEGKGMPKEWQPAVWLGGVNYEVRIDSAKLPLGVRLPLLVRATDAVGLSDPPSRTWLEVGAAAASKLNSITGKVMLSGRGEPDLPVMLTGPGGDQTARTRQGGVFRFDDLEPGQYKVSVRAPVRNQIRSAEQTSVTVEAAPASPASVTLELK